MCSNKFITNPATITSSETNWLLNCGITSVCGKSACPCRSFWLWMRPPSACDTVFALVRAGALPPACLDAMRAICQKLYAAGLNIDYFPTNFIPRAGTLYYVDYECNAYMEQWDFEHWGIQYWSQTPAFLEYLRDHEN